MFDYFGVNFTFKIKDKSNFKSNLGGKIFVLFSILAFIFFIYSFLNYWKRQIYNINSSIKIDKPAPTINFNKSEFNLGYALKFDNNDSFIDPQNYNSMMTINLTLVTISDFQSQNKTKLDIVRKNC